MAGGGAELGKKRERGRGGRRSGGDGKGGPQVTVNQGPSEPCYATAHTRLTPAAPSAPCTMNIRSGSL